MPTCPFAKWSWLVCICWLWPHLCSAENPAGGPREEPAEEQADQSVVNPFVGAIPVRVDRPVDWKRLYKGSFRFLALMHAFRVATEEDTREGLKGPFFQGWADSLGAMHGWSDGDPPLVNYVGHPMQGAVTSYLFSMNDPKFQPVQFGWSRPYAKKLLRGAAYAFAFSEQFELGPMSEATIGNVQAKYPAYGFVDHVITPIVGTGWVVAEDVLDKYVIRPIERRTTKTWLRILARLSLNPSRGMANLMNLRVPWRRDDRPTVYWDYEAEAAFRKSGAPRPPERFSPPRDQPVFEFTVQPHFNWFRGPGSIATPCVGGGAVGRFNFRREWTFVTDVGGCRLQGLGRYRTGDSLTYMFGPEWNGRRFGRFLPRLRFLIGGNKVTQMETDPEKIKELEEQGIDWTKNEYHFYFSRDTDKNAFAFLAGGGFDVVLNDIVSLQVANVDYLRTWLGEFEDRNYTHGLRLTVGVTLRVGTW